MVDAHFDGGPLGGEDQELLVLVVPVGNAIDRQPALAKGPGCLGQEQYIDFLLVHRVNRKGHGAADLEARISLAINSAVCKAAMIVNFEKPLSEDPLEVVDVIDRRAIHGLLCRARAGVPL